MLTSVNDDMLGQVPHVHEGLAAHAALMGADVVMVADVIGQLAGLDESVGPQGEGSARNCPSLFPGAMGWASCLVF